MGVKRERLPVSTGSLQLDLAHTSLLPGATLRGTVTLTIAEPVEAAVITVNIEGVQTLQWSTVAGNRYAFAQPNKVTAKHLDVEDVLGELNGSLAPGVHVLPFQSKLPSDLLASTKIDRLVQKLPEKLRRAWFDINYSVSAKLEVAGLSNPSLQQTCPFVVVKIPESRAAQPVAATHEESVRPILGLGHAKPCTIQMQLTSDGFDIATGVIDADVKIELDVNLKLHHVHLVLYEDMVMHVSKNYDEGGKQDPRVICRQTYKAKYFTPMNDDVSGMTRTVGGRLQLKITDPDAEEYGPLVPFLDSRPFKICHRVGVECSFLLGSRVSMSVPVTLVDAVALAA